MKIERRIKDNILRWIDRPEVIILRGARRVGKTTLLREIYDELPSPKAFFTCDDIDFLNKVKTPDDLMYILRREHGFDESTKFYLFLDEFHYLPSANRHIKNLYDRYENLKIFVSGSSAIEIIKESEPLTGRSVEFILYPFSFSEILPAVLNLKIEADSQFFKIYKNDIERIFLEYLSFGGFPEVFLESNEELRLIWLAEYIHRYIEKDIVYFTRIDNVQGFNNLLKLLASQLGNITVFSELSNTLGLSYPTVVRYITLLQSTFVIDLVRPFATNPRIELTKSPKVYFFDLGLRNRLLGINDAVKFNPNIGKEVENFVYLAVKQIFEADKIHFYRTNVGAEIDFVIELDYKRLLLLEVKFRPNPKPTPSIRHFLKKYGNKFEIQTILATKDTYKVDHDISYIPVPMLPFELEKYKVK